MLHPAQVGTHRLLAGVVLPLVPRAVIMRGHAQQHADDTAVGDAHFLTAFHDDEVHLARLEDTQAVAESVEGALHQRVGRGLQILGDDRGLERTGHGNHGILAHYAVSLVKVSEGSMTRRRPAAAA